MVFVFEFVYIVDYIDGFLFIEPTLHPRDEAYLVMMDHHFDVFLDLVCEDFIENFFYFLKFFIRYFLYLHFKCYPESPLYTPHALLPYPPTSTSWS